MYVQPLSAEASLFYEECFKNATLQAEEEEEYRENVENNSVYL